MNNQELRNKILALRDEVLALNPDYITAYDRKEVGNLNVESELYDIANALHDVGTRIPYDNLIAKLLQ